MDIDLHSHTATSSRDSDAPPEQMIEAARAAGLDALCVTEHDLIEGALVARDLGRQLDFPVFAGVECLSDIGDFVVFGLERDFAPGFPHLELLALVAEAGGFAFAAHPFRNPTRSLNNHIATVDGLTAIEIENGGTPVAANRRARVAARRLGLRGLGASDAHAPEEVGRAYTRFDRRIRNERELIEALHGGRFEARQLRAARLRSA